MSVFNRPNTSDCPAATVTGMTPPPPGLLSSAGRFESENTRLYETNGPQDDPPRLPFAGNNDLLTTTRRSSWNSVVQQTTYRPWYAGSSNTGNGVDSASQAKLFSSACRTLGNGLILIIPILFLPVVVWWLLLPLMSKYVHYYTTIIITNINQELPRLTKFVALLPLWCEIALKYPPCVTFVPIITCITPIFSFSDNTLVSFFSLYRTCQVSVGLSLKIFLSTSLEHYN